MLAAGFINFRKSTIRLVLLELKNAQHYKYTNIAVLSIRHFEGVGKNEDKDEVLEVV